MSIPSVLGRVLALITLMLVSLSAWSMTISPSPSTNGTYTVTWSTPTGCNYQYFSDYPYVIFDCYQLHEVSSIGGTPPGVPDGSTSWTFTGRSVATYTYTLVYSHGWIDGGYEQDLESQSVDVIPPVTAYFTINDVAVGEGGDLVFTVTKNNSAGANVSVSYATADFSAVAPADYSSTSGVLTFTPAETIKTITVHTVNDGVWEQLGGNETMYVNLSSPTGGASIADSQGVGTIIENNPAPTVSISDASVTEGGNLSFTLTKSGSHDIPLTVSYSFADGTATANVDYSTSGQSPTFLPNETSKIISVATIDDSVFETTETMFVNITNASNATVTRSQGVGTIFDNDPAPTWSVTPVAPVTEGAPLQFVIFLSGNSSQTHSVNYTTSDGSAVQPSDYTAQSGTVTLPAAAGQTISVVTINDTLFENPETVGITLSAPTGGSVLGSASTTGTINSDDAAPTFSISSNSPVTEGGAALQFTVTLNGQSQYSHNVNYATGNGTAVAPGDYTAASGTLAGFTSNSSQVVNVAIVDDTVYENPETLTLALSAPTNGAQVPAAATATINSNDAGPVFSISSDVSAKEGLTLGFTVTKTGATEVTHTVNVSTAATGTATSGTDFTAITNQTLTFTPAQTNQSVNVITIQDTVIEGNETFPLTLSSPSTGTSLGTATRTGTILNDDVSFSISSNVSANEGSPLSFAIQKTGQDGLSHSVTVNTANGSAAAGSDYTAISGLILTFTDAQLNQNVAVTTATDAATEGNETFTLNLSAPTAGAVLGTSQRTGTIIDVVPPSLSINSVTAPEGTTAGFTVTRSGVTTGTQTVSYTTSNGSGAGAATAGVDYTSTSGTLQFTPGVVTLPINVATLTDVYYEGNETFSVTLSNAVGATITNATGTGTIDDANDDATTGASGVSLAPNTTGYMPGSTPGGLTVDVTGNSSYKLAIAVPPGTAGMQPDLALVYNSGSGNGSVGVGWGVAGLSSITRCPQTPAQDAGGITAISYTASDRFCLDGQRLILVPATGAYGANGAEYRTEINQFAQIHSFGSAGTGPAYFRVRTKGGRILYYGNTPDSAVEIGPSQSTIRAWAVNKIEDTVGNYMTFSYQDQSLQTDVELTQIAYTLHNNGTLGAVAFAHVNFEYEARETYGPVYRGGWAITNTTRRLKSIKTEALTRDPTTGASTGWALVRDYRLGYGTGNNNQSRLTSVQECPGTGLCLPPTTFGWWNMAAAPTLPGLAVTWPSAAVASQKAPLFGDFNGDGRMDLFAQDDTYQPPNSDGVSTMYLADVNGVQQPVWNAPTGPAPNGWHKWDAAPDANLNQLYTGDFNGDGMTDIARVWWDQIDPNNYSATLYVYLSTGTSMVPVGSPIPLGGSDLAGVNSNFVGFADFNGDGRTDVRAGLGVYIAAANGSGQLTYSALPPGQDFGGFPGDFNGDGRIDGLQFVSATQWQVNFSNGIGFVPSGVVFTDSSLPPGSQPVVADLNGDGLDDLILLVGTTARAYLSKGDGQFAQAWIQTGVYHANITDRIYIGDWNNDGRADIAYYDSSRTNLSFYVSTTQNTLQFLQTLNWPSPTNGGASVWTGDWNGDGTTDFWNHQPSSNSVYITSAPRDVVNRVTDGLGAVTTLVYAPMSDTSVYVKDTTPSSYPAEGVSRAVVQSSRPLVKTVNVDDGVGGQRSLTYSYEHAVAELQRRGGLGFAKVKVTDTLTNVREETTYSQQFPFVGMALLSERYYKNGSNDIKLRSVTSALGGATAVNSVYFPFVQQQTARVYEPNDVFTGNAFVAKTITMNTYDATYGNLTSVDTENFETDAQTTGTGEFRVQTTSDFFNDTANWLIGELICERMFDPANVAVAGFKRTTGFEYSAVGLVTKQVLEPDNGSITEPGAIPQCAGNSGQQHVTLITAIDYDLFGNPLTRTVDDLATDTSPAPNQPARITRLQYGEINASNATVVSNGRFPIRIENALNHVQYIQYDERFGVPRRIQDANLFNTQRTYDEYGRLVHEQRLGFPSADIYRGWCTAATCANGGKLKSVAVTQGAPVTATEIDFLGRETAQLQTSFGGKTVVTRTKYTGRGEVDMVSRPYFFDALTTDMRWIDYGYDAISRVTSESVPGETGLVTTTTNYSPGVVDQYAFEVTRTNALNQTTKQRYHVRGLLDRVYTAYGVADQSDTKFTYDVFGNVLTTQVNGNAATTVTHTYDVRGRERTLRDPDLAPNNGVWTFDYFSNGDEIYRQTDAKGQTATLTYDLLGRMTQRVEPEGTTIFTFDPANGKGMLGATTAPEGLNKTYEFDGFGRHYRTTATVTGTGAGAGAYQTTFGFDPTLGRMTGITYPTSNGSTLTVSYDYNANGYVRQVKNAAGGAAYWTLDATTAEGQIKNVTFGNGINTENRYQTQTSTIDEIRTGPSNGTSIQNLQYDFDSIGNLTRRADVNQNISERMTVAGAYDAQNRLKTVERLTGTTVAQTKNVTYDPLGNIVTKSDITGSYNYTQTPQTSCPTGYTTNPGPHALRRTGTTTTNYRHYCYDRNGNQTRGWNFTENRQRTVTWKSFNMPATIAEGTPSIAFSYGADRQRFRQVNGFASSQTTIYIDDLFDRQVVGTTTTDLHYVLAYGQAVAVFSRDSTGVTSTRYLHRDHLGSVTHTTNESGVVAETLSYDPWGKRRNTNWTDWSPTPPAPSLRRPAYTGHENMQEVSLVNMNGRVYDPSVSHMLSADPFVQFPADGQSYNRYSYVFNNPLRYTDPSGFCLPIYNAPSSFCNNPLAGSGLLGRGSTQPSVGRTQTVMIGGGRFGFDLNVSIPGVMGDCSVNCNGGGILEHPDYIGFSIGYSVVAWEPSAQYSVAYAGLIAGDSGESSGGALATQTISGYEGRTLGTIESVLVAGRRSNKIAQRSATASSGVLETVLIRGGKPVWYSTEVYGTPEEAVRAARDAMRDPANAARLAKGGEFKTHIDSVPGGFAYATSSTQPGLDYYACPSGGDKCQSPISAFTGGGTVYVMHSHAGDLNSGPSTCAGCDFDALGNFNAKFGAQLEGIQMDSNGVMTLYGQQIVHGLKLKRGGIVEGRQHRINSYGLFE